MTKLQDGTGGDYWGKISNENHLHVAAIVESLIGHRSHYDATAFGASTPFLTVNTTGGKMFYVKNDSSDKDFFISDMWFSWNGGNTTGIKCVQGIFYFGDDTPLANNTKSSLGVLNRGVNNSAEVTVEYWDGVGNGMTMTTTGDPDFYWMNTKGHNHIDIKSAIILGTNSTVSINLKAEEVGVASINLYGFVRSK